MKKLSKLLVGVDFAADGKQLSVGSRCAIEEARALAVHHTAELVLLHSTHGDEYVDPLTAHAAVVSLGATPQGRKALDDALAGLQKSGVKASLELSEERPLAAFVRRVQLGDIELVVVGKRSDSDEDGRHLGSFSIQLLRYCPGAVLVVPPRPGVDEGPVLAATDLSPVGDVATRVGALLSLQRDVDLHVVHAYQLPFELIHESSRVPREQHQEHLARLRREAEQGIAKGLAGAKASGEPKLHVACSTPSRAIQAAIDLVHPSILVMGTISRGGVAGLLFGNTAERILPRVSCAILAVKPADFVSPILN